MSVSNSALRYTSPKMVERTYQRLTCHHKMTSQPFILIHLIEEDNPNIHKCSCTTRCMGRYYYVLRSCGAPQYHVVRLSCLKAQFEGDFAYLAGLRKTYKKTQCVQQVLLLFYNRIYNENIDPLHFKEKYLHFSDANNDRRYIFEQLLKKDPATLAPASLIFCGLATKKVEPESVHNYIKYVFQKTLSPQDLTEITKINYQLFGAPQTVPLLITVKEDLKNKTPKSYVDPLLECEDDITRDEDPIDPWRFLEDESLLDSNNPPTSDGNDSYLQSDVGYDENNFAQMISPQALSPEPTIFYGTPVEEDEDSVDGSETEDESDIDKTSPSIEEDSESDEGEIMSTDEIEKTSSIQALNPESPINLQDALMEEDDSIDLWKLLNNNPIFETDDTFMQSDESPKIDWSQSEDTFSFPIFSDEFAINGW